MGTRTLVHIKDEKKTIATIYRQYDGYPSGIGNEIVQILNKGNVTILNGFSSSHSSPSHFNGMGCLGAFLIGELKQKKIGNVYVFPPNSKGVGEEYTYTITNSKSGIKMKVVDTWNGKVLFNGLLRDFNGELVESNNQ